MTTKRLTSIALALAAGGCSGPTAPPAKAVDRSYRMTGVVRAVEPTRGEVTIRHETIPGFMGRMTMTLPVADRSDLDEVRAGDEVEATLRVRGDRSVLEGLSVTRPALPGPIAEPSGRFAAPPPPRAIEAGAEVPDFAMTTQDGAPLRLSDLRGKVVVLTFVYTRCPLPDFCPLIDRRFKDLASKVAAVPGRAGRVRLLSVSFDPEHDTPAALSKHARALGARPPLWGFAVAPHEELREVAGALGLVYIPGGDEVSHNLSTSVIDARGRLSRRFEGRDWAPDDVLAEVRRTLAGGADRGEIRPHDIGER